MSTDSIKAPSVDDVPLRTTHMEKELRTVQAQAALRGVVLQLIELDGGGGMYIVSRWKSSRTFASLAEALALVDRLAGVGR